MVGKGMGLDPIKLIAKTALARAGVAMAALVSVIICPVLAPAQEPITLKGHAGIVWTLAFSPNGKVLASGSADQTVKLWDLATNKVMATLEPAKWTKKGLAFAPEVGAMPGRWAVRGVAFSPDGKTLAAVGFRQPVTLWDVQTRKVKATLPECQLGAHCLAFSPKAQILATGSYDNRVRLWDLTNHKELAALKGHGEFLTSHVPSLAFSPDGKILASAGRDRTVILWDVPKRKLRLTLNGHKDVITSVAFSPEGQIVASGSEDGSAIWWDSAMGKRKKTFAVTKLFPAWIKKVHFFPGGNGFTVVTISSPCERVDLRTKTKDQTLHSGVGHGGFPECYAFSPDGKTLAIGDREFVAKLWRFRPGLDIPDERW